MARRTQTTSEGHGAADEAQRSAAVGALLACLGDEGAARAAGVSTRTVRRWRTTDEAFKAEYAEGLEYMKRANLEGSVPLLAKAIKVLDQALDEGDSTVALGIYRANTPTKVTGVKAEDGGTAVQSEVRVTLTDAIELAKEKP
jgi:hypothetical protein